MRAAAGGPGSEGSKGSEGKGSYDGWAFVPRVLKFDGLSGRGLWYRPQGDEFYKPPAAVTSKSSIIIRITTVHPFATSWPSSPKGDARSVTGLAFYVIWHDKHSADWLTAFATPYPAVPDFSTGKRVTRFSGRFASLRIVFPCHPCSGGRTTCA